MHTKVILDESSGASFFYQIKSDSEGDDFSETTRFEVSVTDGKDLWKGIRVSWKDLMACKPEGIESSSHESFTKDALMGIKCSEVSDSLTLSLQITLSGNLSLSWKLKQTAFSVTLGTIMLLKSGQDEAQRTIVSLLADSFTALTALQARLAQVESSLASQERLNKSLLAEYEQLSTGRLEWENQVYSKMMLLLNTKKERIKQLLEDDYAEDGFETE